MEEEHEFILISLRKNCRRVANLSYIKLFALFYSSVINGTCPYFTWDSFYS